MLVDPVRLPALAAAVAALLIPAPTRSEEPGPLDTLREQAESLGPLVESDVAREFLAAVADLPTIGEPRIVYYDGENRAALSERETAALTAEELEGYDRKELDEGFYWFTRYGSPLAAVRPLELAGGAGFADADGARICDFGFGSIGQLRLLASLGATVTGVEVDPLLRALYSDVGDAGFIARAGVAGRGSPGSIRLLFGRFPAEASFVDEVGGGYDLFVSKNTLKRGYIHPEEEVDARRLVQLGVDDAEFVRSLHRMLKPGGIALIYNLCPAPAKEGEPYKPWADGRSPFARELWEQVGFEIVAFDEDDTDAARRMGEALGWAEQMNLKEDLFGIYTMTRKK